MTESVAPKPEFLFLAENTVLAALDDPDPTNPVAVEVARLVTVYTNNFRDHVERIGYIPAEILRVKPRWPIEAVAMRLTTKVIREALAKPRITRRHELTCAPALSRTRIIRPARPPVIKSQESGRVA
jgi:hypothetical protein